MAEKKPVYMLFIGRPKQAWYELSEKERKEHQDKMTKSGEEVGGKTIVTAWSRWSNEEWSLFGVAEFPDIEAVQKRVRFNEESEHYKYFEMKTYLGTHWEPV